MGETAGIRSRRLLLGVLCLSAGGLASQALAESADWTLGVNPGWTFPLGAAGETSKSALIVQASAERRFLPSLSGGLELGWVRSNQEGTIGGIDFTSSVYSTFVQATPFVRLSTDLDTDGVSWRPYGLLGAGFYDGWNGTGSITTSSGLTGSVASTSGIAHFGINVGIGAVADLGGGWCAGLDLRYHHIFTRQDFDADGGGSDPIQLLVPSLRIGYSFGGED